MKKSHDLHQEKNLLGNNPKDPLLNWSESCGAYNPYAQTPYAQTWTGYPGFTIPKMGLCYDVFDEGEQLVIEIPFPGLIRDSLEVVVERNYLIVRGQTEAGEGQQSHKGRTRHLILSQIPKGNFEQAIPLAFEVNPSGSSAAFANGILTIHLKKSASELNNRISVTFS